jgi:chromosome segregation ATPase
MKNLQSKLQRNKNIEVKELLQHKESAENHNRELATKLADEKANHDKLLHDKLELDEQMETNTRQEKELADKNSQTAEVLTQLRAKIDEQTKASDELNLKVDEAKKTNKTEEERYRRLVQQNAALKAKLEFIQSKYDFTTNVNVLKSDDFQQLMSTNEIVSHTSHFTLNRLGQLDDG